MEYTYNLSGAMVEEKYPSGRVVKTVLDGEGELKTVKSQKNSNNAFWNYANHFTYTAAGAETSRVSRNEACGSEPAVASGWSRDSAFAPADFPRRGKF